MGWRVPSAAAMPSMVVIWAPLAWSASMVQLLMDLPSTWTTQAPHWLVSQPTWVPVRPSFSRSSSTRRVRPSTSTLCGFPFTVSDTCGMVVVPRLDVRRAPMLSGVGWRGQGGVDAGGFRRVAPPSPLPSPAGGRGRVGGVRSLRVIQRELAALDGVGADELVAGDLADQDGRAVLG